MAVADPASIRYEQCEANGLASINGVNLVPLEKTLALGDKVVRYRARYTAGVIREAIAAGNRQRDDALSMRCPLA